jgi:pSer/pThr/pTyr-binding forkhead associated (FHA) protein
VPAPVPSAAGVGAPIAIAVPDPAPSTTMIYRSFTAPEDDVPAAEPQPPQEIVTLTLDGRSYPVTSAGVVIGRSRECDIRVVDGNASRRHAEVVRQDDDYVVVDLGSTNGTDLNGRRITRETLSDGDRITIGATDVVFGRTLP